MAGSAAVVPGGESRSESVANALKEVESELVVVHDAARPLAPPRLFDAVVAELAARLRVRRHGCRRAGRRHAQASPGRHG